MNIFLAFASLLVVVNSAPQGDIGIDFGGFRVGAGLNGGPHAFAQTPFGPKAAAGVGGQTGAFAGAEVNEGLGAAAGVGANGAGSVAQAPGVVKYKYKGVSPAVGVRSSVNIESAPVPASTVGGGATYQVTKTASPNFFNDIFNIPISTLRAVNQLVNGVQTTKQVSASSYPTNTYKEVSVGSQPSAVSVSKSVAPVTVSKPDLAVRTTVTKTASPDLYNNIFNIPISALKAVNNLLNGISG